MLLTGMEKLRLVVTFLFFAYVIIYACAMISSNITTDADQQWIDGLTDDEYDELTNLMDNYPVVDTAIFDNMIFILDLSIGGGLLLLMIKLWTIQSISNTKSKELNYQTLKQEIVGTTDRQTKCRSCGQTFTFKSKIGIPTYIQCPFCSHRDVFDETKQDNTHNQKTTVCWNCKHTYTYTPTLFRTQYVRCPKCGQQGIINNRDKI